jgi:hypothetical protein
VVVVCLTVGLPVRASADWERVYSDDGLVVEARPHPGSEIKEVRAQGIMPVPPRVVRAVIADVDRYHEFMPYVKDARVLSRSRQGTITYQRVSFGFLGTLGLADRDYVLRNVERIRVSSDGTPTYKRMWNAISTNGPPPEPGVIRLTLTRGFWLLSRADGSGTRTQVLYCLFTDPGGSLPVWAVNQGNTVGVPKVFAAVRTAAQLPRYADAPAPDVAALLASPPDFTGMDESMCADR